MNHEENMVGDTYHETIANPLTDMRNPYAMRKINEYTL
jgi:hypothetical protein